MSHYSPHLLPKVRSDVLMQAIGGNLPKKLSGPHYPCTLRIAGLIPGHRCASPDTVVGCHLGNLGKGMSTKVSDLNVGAGCKACHDLIDMVDKRWFKLMEDHGVTVLNRIISSIQETQAMLIRDGIIKVKGGTII
jgi:hypothetical protein